VVIQSANAAPQWISVPVMFVLGGSASGPAITQVSNAASGTGRGAPGMLLSIYGSRFADAPQQASGSPLPYNLGGGSAVVNVVAAPLGYVSPTQVNIQIPYEAGAGPAVVGLIRNGSAAGFQFTIMPAAPGIFSDSGKLLPQSSVTVGKTATLYLTGAGEAPT